MLTTLKGTLKDLVSCFGSASVVRGTAVADKIFPALIIDLAIYTD